MVAEVISWFTEEWLVISQAPLTFIVALPLLTGVVWWLVDWVYASRIKSKDAVIEILKAKANGLEPNQTSRSELKTAILDVRGPALYQDHLTVAKRWRMIVHNRGPDAAGNVLMRLRSIDPQPRYWVPDYPYMVTRTLASAHNQLFGGKINPNDEDTYEVLAGWDVEGDFYTDKLDTKRKIPIRIEPDERWELKYDVMAENATPISFSLIMCVKNGAVFVERKN